MRTFAFSLKLFYFFTIARFFGSLTGGLDMVIIRKPPKNAGV